MSGMEEGRLETGTEKAPDQSGWTVYNVPVTRRR